MLRKKREKNIRPDVSGKLNWLVIISWFSHIPGFAWLSIPSPHVRRDALPPLNFGVRNFTGMTRYTVLLALIQSQVCMSERGFHSRNWVLYSVSGSIFGG